MNMDTEQQTAPTEKAPDWNDAIAASAEAQKPEPETFMHAVRQKFSPEELQKRIAEMGAAIAEAAALGLDAEAKSEAAKDAKKAHAKAVARWEELSVQVVTGEGDVEVLCTEVPVFERNAFEIRRVDNGELVDERPMDASDRQPDLFGKGSNGEPFSKETGEYVDEAPESDDDTSITDPEAVATGTTPKKRARKSKSAEA